MSASLASISFKSYNNLMKSRKPHPIVALFSLITSLAGVVAFNKWVQPLFPEEPTVEMAFWLGVMIAIALGIHYWERKLISRSIFASVMISSLWMLFPESRYWIYTVSGTVIVFWLGMRFERISCDENMTVQPRGKWVEEEFAIEYIRKVLLGLGRDFESDTEIRKRIVKGVSSGVLKGKCLAFTGEEWQRIGRFDAEEIIYQRPAWARNIVFPPDARPYAIRFWSKSLIELTTDIRHTVTGGSG